MKLYHSVFKQDIALSIRAIRCPFDLSNDSGCIFGCIFSIGGDNRTSGVSLASYVTNSLASVVRQGNCSMPLSGQNSKHVTEAYARTVEIKSVDEID